MRQDERAPFDRALHRARVSAYAPGEFVGQESFMTAGEIRALAAQAGIGPGVAVLDVCCGIAGPGRLVTRELGCDYLGVDASASAVAIARERADGLPCRFAVAQVPPLPAGSFDVVLLLETMLAFEDKDALVRAIAAALRPGGRFAFTLEEGPPLTPAERAAMPDADTVWLTPLDELAASPGAGRARRHVAGGPQPRAPRDGAGAGGRVRRGRRATSPRRSAAGRWTTCSPPTGCGSSGWTRGGCGSSRWWRSGRRASQRAMLCFESRSRSSDCGGRPSGTSASVKPFWISSSAAASSVGRSKPRSASKPPRPGRPRMVLAAERTVPRS